MCNFFSLHISVYTYVCVIWYDSFLFFMMETHACLHHGKKQKKKDLSGWCSLFQGFFFLSPSFQSGKLSTLESPEEKEWETESFI